MVAIRETNRRSSNEPSVPPLEDLPRADSAAKHKLLRAKSKGSQRPNGNKWLEVDRDEKIKAVLTVAGVLAVLGVGMWFGFHSLGH